MTGLFNSFLIFFLILLFSLKAFKYTLESVAVACKHNKSSNIKLQKIMPDFKLSLKVQYFKFLLNELLKQMAIFIFKILVTVYPYYSNKKR